MAITAALILLLPPSIAVDVSYFINQTMNGTATVPVHPLAMNSSARRLLTPSYSLQWVSHRSLLPFGNVHVLAPRTLGFITPEISNPVVMLVIPPICNSSSEGQSILCSETRIKKLLSRLTSKLKLYNSASTQMQTGYVVLIEHGVRSYFDGEAGTTTEDFLSLPLKIFMVMFQITALIGTTTLLPLVLVRLGILPSPTNDDNESNGENKLDLSLLGNTMGINFLSISFTCFIASMHMFSEYDIETVLSSLPTGTNFIIYLIYLPLAVPVLAFVDTVIISLYCYIQYCCRFRVNGVLSIIARAIGCIIIMIFFQLLIFHVGWMLPLFVAFPLKIGTLIFEYACTLVYSYFGAFVITLIFAVCYGCCIHKQVKLWSWIVQQYSLGLLTQSGLYLALIYYQTQTSSDDGSKDPIATTVSALIPGALVTLLTWMVNKYISTDPIEDAKDEGYIRLVNNAR